MKQHSFLNGKIIPLAEAKVSVLDIGLLRGFGIYEALAVIKGKPLHFRDHWQRLERGAKALNLKVPITAKLAEEKIIEIVKKSGLTTRANIRIILTGGGTIKGIEHDSKKPTFYMVAEKWKSLPKENYEKGVKLISHEHQRELPELKTTNYIVGASLQSLKNKRGALEILYIHEGKVLECATSNIFLVKGVTLITPKDNILEGVTRKIVLGLSNKNYKIEKREVSLKELKLADEVFITASFKDIVPVVKIDNFIIGMGQVGRATKDFMERFRKYIRLQTI